MQKPKFKPKVTKVKLNPEQAVLQCDCYRFGRFTPLAHFSGDYFAEVPGAPFLLCVSASKGIARLEPGAPIVDNCYIKALPYGPYS